MDQFEEALLYYLVLKSQDPPEVVHVHHAAPGGGGVSEHDNLTGVNESQHHQHAYGEIYVHDNIVASDAPGVLGTWYQFVLFDKNGPCHETVPDHTNDHITVGLTGDYLISFSVSMFDAQTHDWEFAVYTNNGTVYLDNIELQATMLAASKVLSSSCCGIASLSAGDTVELWYKCISNGATDLTVKLANLNLFRLL